MKWLFVDVIPLYGVSPPARGAWIEIYSNHPRYVAEWSPPARGAWIEIPVCRPYQTPDFVAPRTGGVD